MPLFHPFVLRSLGAASLFASTFYFWREITLERSKEDADYDSVHFPHVVRFEPHLTCAAGWGMVIGVGLMLT